MSTDAYETPSRSSHPDEAEFSVDETVDTEVALDFLATLSSFDYERTRKKEAKRLCIRVSELDRLLAQHRQHICANKTSSETGFQLVEFEPSTKQVNGEKMMGQLVTLISRHLVLPALAIIAVALWIIRAHAHNCFNVNPRLAFLSPEKRSGKTTALEVVSLLTPRALMSSNATPASIFRMIERDNPTLLLDEMDTFKDSHPELRAILNSGHRKKGAYVLRCVGDEHEPKAFSTWCPIVVGAIGTLPDTLLDRSIAIKMHRRTKQETIYPLNSTRKEEEAINREFTAMGQAIARWVIDHASALREMDPVMPEQLNDRAADNWSPLIAIAEVIGGQWPEKARSVAIALSGSTDTDGESIGIQLLDDIRASFAIDKQDRITSRALCVRLAKLEERPWQTSLHGRPITPAQLARLLRSFEIRSQDIWVGSPPKSAKGYVREAFDQVFKRYLAGLPNPAPSGAPNREDARMATQGGASTVRSRFLADQMGEIKQQETRLRELSKVWRRVKAIKEPRR
ncbi:MAG: DUF3631 domain-containing protein [Nitrospira sp.]|nr:DUF3631 domain-containing protein [Nitrospira sp.]